MHTHTQWNITQSLKKKKERMPFAGTWVDLEIIILSKFRERQIPNDTTYIWNLKSDTNELIYKTEIDSDTENKLMVTKRESGEIIH